MAQSFPKFGSNIPFAEPAWYRGAATSNYDDSHVELRQRMRAFVDEHILPYVDEWEERCCTTGEELDAKALCKKAVAAGIFAPMMPVEYGGTPLPSGVEFDAFHDLVWIDELSRIGAGGIIALLTTWTMALPPVLLYGTEYVKDKVVKPVLTGEKMIALCISEPTAGSDVASIKTTAEDMGDYWLVNGQKKWITTAVHADFFTTAVKTSDKNGKGVSILLIESNTPGVKVRRMKLQGQWLAGTGVVTFDDVKVPKLHLVGKLHQGLKPLMTNFNHERLVIAMQAIRQCRLCIEESVAFARSRITFGVPLISHQVIRHKIAEMSRLTEGAFALGESLAFQLKHGANAENISAPMALLKVTASKTFELCAREASQILGGASFTRDGKGQRVERLYREVRSYAIPGGSEEIMLDYAMKASKL